MTGAPVWAGSPPAPNFPPVAPEELRMTSEPLAPGTAAVILQRRVDRDDDLRAQEDDYYRIKVLTEEGRGRANVEIRFYRGWIGVSNIRARTVQPDGTVVNFDGQVYERELIKDHWWKYMVKTFTLPDVRVGSVLEYAYTLDLPKGYLFDSRWVLSDELFTKDAQFSLKPHMHAVSPLSLRWTWRELPVGLEPKEGADHIFRMEAHNIPAFVTEDFMPPQEELKSRVDFIYEERGAQRDADEFWKQFVKQNNDFLDKYVDKRKVLEEAVRQIVSPEDSPDVKLRKIYARAQSLRNTSFEVEKSEKEQKRSKEKAADNVADVWKHGYGSAGAIDWLFLGLARAAGFDAYGCLVADRSDHSFDRKLMDSSGLRETIVLVKLNGKDVYLDPGEAFAPFGLLPWFETASPGIRLDKNGGEWINTPLPAASESEIRHQGTFKLTDAGDLEGTVTTTYTGLEALAHRVTSRHSDEVERKRLLENLLKEQVPATAEVELTRQPDWNGSDQPFTAQFSVTIRNWATNAGRRILVPAGVFGQAEKHIFEHAERVHPIYFGYLYRKVDDVTIELPPGTQVTAVPESQNRKLGEIGYDIKVAEEKGKLHISRQLDLGVLMLPKERYPVLRNFFQALRTADEGQIVLQPGSAAATN